MNTYACKYCNKWWTTNQSRNGHQIHCTLNPKKKELELKVKQSNRGKCCKPISKTWVSKICNKCGKEYSVYITKESDFSGRYKKFCSLSCANSRQHSQQTKDKIGAKVKSVSKQKIKSICEVCGQEYFKSILTPNRKYCNTCITNRKSKQSSWHIKNCIQCGKQFVTHKINKSLCKGCKSIQSAKHVDWSSIQKQAYASGRNYVAGGTTKWIEVETSNGVIKVQGSYQQRMCKVLDRMKELEEIKDWQYTNDRISYVGIDNKEHSYLLDFKVYHTDQSIRYIETKGRVQQNDYCKWQSTRQKGYDLQICFQTDIKNYELQYSI